MFDKFLNKYPYSDFHELNLDWIISEVNRLNQNLTDLEERIKEETLEACKIYIDEKVEEILNDFNSLSQEVANLRIYVDENVEELQNQYNQFTNQVQAQITLLTQRIDEFRNELNASIIGVNARTDLLIAQNNEYILEQVAKGVVNAKVLNYFTGDYVTVQAMFNYLAQLHADNGITYTNLALRNKTYTELAGLNITYTQLAMNGNILIV